VIPLLTGSVETSDNGRGRNLDILNGLAILADVDFAGLQCYTAQFTWKLVFDIKHRQYEIILSACSEKEEDVWKTQLRNRIQAEATERSEARINNVEVFSMGLSEVKSIGPSFVSFTNFSRRRSIHRAATLGPKSCANQVIIKNTEAQKYVTDTNVSFSVGRSQSHMSSTHVPTLAPRRTERIRMENSLADVWTTDILPYPGMGSKRTEHTIRASANSVMRKLSMASIASNFSKRSTGHTSLHLQRFDDGYASSSGQSLKTVRPKKTTNSQNRPTMVDFHNTPNAFLPDDFELDLKPDRRVRKLQNRLSLNTTVPRMQSSGRDTPNSENISTRHKYLDVQAIAQSAAAAFGFDGAGDAVVSRDGSLTDRFQDTCLVPDSGSAPPPEPAKKRSLKARRLFKFFS
jgi:hypothetical protein